jgi:hypothetical protein
MILKENACDWLHDHATRLQNGTPHQGLGGVSRTAFRSPGLRLPIRSRDVRYGSLTDITAALSNVRFTHERDINENRRDVR